MYKIGNTGINNKFALPYLQFSSLFTLGSIKRGFRFKDVKRRGQNSFHLGESMCRLYSSCLGMRTYLWFTQKKPSTPYIDSIWKPDQMLILQEMESELIHREWSSTWCLHVFYLSTNWNTSECLLMGTYLVESLKGVMYTCLLTRTSLPLIDIPILLL